VAAAEVANWNAAANRNSYKATGQQYLYVITARDGSVQKYGTSFDPEFRYTRSDFDATFGAGSRLSIIGQGDARFVRHSESRLIRTYSVLHGGTWHGKGMIRPPENKTTH
jgi:hypothetical protein